MKENIFAIALTVVLTTLTGSTVYGADYDAVKEKLEAAMAADIRTTQETDRDRNRKPSACKENSSHAR